MTTSKIEKIVDTKDYTNDYGTTIYHSLIMENGDKINIGKKKPQQVGWELTYEVVGDEGQQEYTKARSVQKEQSTGSPKKDDYVKGIEVGHAVNNAVNMICAGVELNVQNTSGTSEEKIYLYAKVVMGISNRLKSE